MNCTHRWRIPETDGNRYTTGACVACGETRTFDNRGENWLKWGEFTILRDPRTRELYPDREMTREAWR